MSETKTIWHLYPEETPPLSGFYLVTAVFGTGSDASSYVMSATYKEEEGCFWVGSKFTVLAWAELPPPYKKGAKRCNGTYLKTKNQK